VLIGPVAAGKSTWAAQHFRPDQIVSSDALRAVVGEGEHDLRASADAFALLEQIVTRRVRRRLTTVVDSLGFDAAPRATWRRLAAEAGVPCLAVVFDTASAECRRRNSARPVAVPADVVAGQLQRWPSIRDEVTAEPWDEVLTPEPVVVVPACPRDTAAIDRRRRPPRPRRGHRQ
jgi:predicted kinase